MSAVSYSAVSYPAVSRHRCRFQHAARNTPLAEERSVRSAQERDVVADRDLLVHNVREVLVDGRGVDAGLREDVSGVVASWDELDLDDARGDELTHL